MPYCVLSDILAIVPEAKLLQLTDDSGLGAVDSDRVDQAAADASSEIDGYLAARYAVPVNPVPDLVRKLAVDLVVYNLYARRVNEVPESHKDRYKNAIRLLENIAKGVVTLGTLNPPEEAPAVASSGAAFIAPTRVFSRDSLKDY